jgi:hypothetical protein
MATFGAASAGASGAGAAFGLDVGAGSLDGCAGRVECAAVPFLTGVFAVLVFVVALVAIKFKNESRFHGATYLVGAALFS